MDDSPLPPRMYLMWLKYYVLVLARMSNAPPARFLC